MKKYILMLAALFMIVSCSDVRFSDEMFLREASVAAVKIEPPIAVSGQKIKIYAAADSGRGEKEEVSIKVGNKLFSAADSAELTIPENIALMFGNDAAEELGKDGYVDVPVTISLKNSEASAKKYFRIVNTAVNSSFSVNPELSLYYKSKNSNETPAVANGDMINYDTMRNPSELTFLFTEKFCDDIARKEYSLSWKVSGSTEELPQLVEFDEESGKAVFDFSDSDGDPLRGEYGFYLLLTPDNTYSGLETARYSGDFIAFYINTKGE